MEAMKVYFHNLAIEVTRRCNMRCEHCLRGDAQDLDIDTEVIDKVLERTSSISNLTLTGGEPSLNVSALEYITQKIKDRDIQVGSIYMVTNGKEVSDEFMLACLKLYMLADDDGEVSGLALSQDMFHDDIPRENIHKLKQLATFRSNDKKTDFTKVPVIDIGRGANLNLPGVRKRFITRDDLEVNVDDAFNVVNVESTVTVTVTGDLLSACDYSYDEVDNLTVANVRDPNWVDGFVEKYAV